MSPRRRPAETGAPLTPTKRNFLANLTSSGWTALAGLVCTPLYLRFLGPEAYGLVGFHLMLQGVVQVLDMGLSPTMNREMARYGVLPGKEGEARDLVRTLEAGYWAIGALIGAALCLAAPLVADHWVRAATLPREDVVGAVRIMGVVAALQWPLTLYQGGLLGLQRQVLLSGVNILSSGVASFGALLVLWRVSPTARAFFAWQLLAALLQAGLTVGSLWRSLPRGEERRPPRVVPALLRQVWRFAAGVSGITLAGLLLTNMDRLVLSRLLPLGEFGYYVLAGLVGNALVLVAAPMFNTVFPRFSALAASGDREGLLRLYHGATQVMAVLTLPVAAVTALFAHDIMLLWTGDPAAARAAAPVVRLLVAGTAMNGLMQIPFALQLAHGWTRVGLVITASFVVLMVPALLLLVGRFGATGGAMAWLLTNGCYVAVGIPLTHRKLFRGEGKRWLLRDVLPPALGALLAAGVGRALVPSLAGASRPAAAAALLLVLLLALCASLLCSRGLSASLWRSLFPGEGGRPGEEGAAP